MSPPGEWEAKLGWLGSFLAGQDARQIEIANHGSFVNVVWDKPSASRQAMRFGLDELARPWLPYKQRRDASSHAARLGALGRAIDQAHIDVASICEDRNGFVVTGSVSGRYENRTFSYSELAQSHATPAASRGAQTASDETEEYEAPTKHNSPLRHRLHLQ